MLMDQLEHDVLEAFDRIKSEELTARTLTGILRTRMGVKKDRNEVAKACEGLVESGHLAFVGEKGGVKRYRLDYSPTADSR